MPTASQTPQRQSKLYNPRHPERTLLCQTVAEHYAPWLELASAGQFDGQGDPGLPVAAVALVWIALFLIPEALAVRWGWATYQASKR